MPTNENLKLTIDEFKQIKGCENIEGQQVSNIIETLFMMSIFAFNAYNKEQNVISYEE
jgi:hypothetical protein